MTQFTRKVDGDDGDWVRAADINDLQEAIEQQSFNVLRYGATGDGVTDDTAAIQAAMTAMSSGDTLLFPPGDYLVGSLVTVSKSIRIIGYGARLIRAHLRCTADSVAIVGIELDGDNHAGGVIDLRGAFQTVRECFIHHTVSNGISMQSALASYSRVIENRIEDTGSESVAPSTQGSGVYGESPGAIIAHNIIRRTRGHGGIFLIDPVNTVMVSNVIENTAWRGINLYSAEDEGEGIVIANNVIRESGGYNDGDSGIGCNGIYANNIVTDPGELLIIGNVIDTVAENGIEARYATIIGNTVRNTGAYEALTTPSTEGIWSSAASIIHGNTVINTDIQGIRLYSDEEIADWICTGNTIINPGTVGIAVQIDTASATMSDVVIANNVITSNQESPTATAGISVTATNSATIDDDTVFVTGNVVVGGISQSPITGVRSFSNSFDTPVAANADTSGETLANVEIEVNQIKAALRSLGLMES